MPSLTLDLNLNIRVKAKAPSNPGKEKQAFSGGLFFHHLSKATWEPWNWAHFQGYETAAFLVFPILCCLKKSLLSNAQHPTLSRPAHITMECLGSLGTVGCPGPEHLVSSDWPVTTFPFHSLLCPL